jgi:hypothetical protein
MTMLKSVLCDQDSNTMIVTQPRLLIPAVLSAALAIAASLPVHAANVVVPANNVAPGDDFTNASGTNTTPSTPGAALGASGWTYNNVRNNGHVGIRTNNPRSGNGSAWFNGTQGPSGPSSKSDLEYLNTNGLGGLVSMGTLAGINSLAYDWYKSSSSAASQHTVLRLYVDADGNFGTANDRGYLVYERAYQTDNSVPTDQWNTDDVSAANLWQVWFGNGNFDTAGNWQSLSVWGSAGGFTPSGGGLHMDANSVVYGLSSGIGSGWGTYTGYVDNITIGFVGSAATTYNFEVEPIPEPSALVLAALGGFVLLVRFRHR